MTVLYLNPYYNEVRYKETELYYAWVKVFRINPELRILRPTFHRKSASKC